MAASSPSISPQREIAPPGRESGKRPRVIVVDDEVGVLRLCERLLSRAGFEAIAFGQPYLALDYLKAHSADVLVVDSRMPEMDGFALMEQARLYHPNLAVVVMSGFANVEMALEALHHGANGMLIKPFERSAELVEAVRRAIAHHRRQEETARLAALQPLFDVIEVLLSETHMTALQRLIIAKTAEVLPNTATGLYMWTKNDSQGKLLAAQGTVPPPDASCWQRVRNTSRLCVLSRQNSETPGEENILLDQYHWHHALATAVQRGEREYGLLVAREQPPAFHTEIDGTVLGILARLAATALENTRLYEDLRHSLSKLERSQRALAQAEKMAAIGRLTASLAHEVNNPIQAVRNSLYLATHPRVSPAQQQAYIQTAREEVERLSTLIHRMLNFYRPGSAERHAVKLPHLIERMIGLLKEEFAQRHITVVNEVPDDLPPIIGVEDQLHQVLLNLLLNALEAMPEGGVLYLLGWTEENEVVVAVEDTGPGVPPDLSERIFEPLVSTKPNGTGLGLAVSYNIIAAHNGNLLLSKPRRGSGAAFHIRLPLPAASEASLRGG